MKTLLKLIPLPLIYLYALMSASPLHAQTPLRIAVASNFAPVLEQLLPEFSQQTGIKVQIISGASGSLYQQIYHGAPFDIFLSADEKRAQQLEQDQLIIANSRYTYAVGEIAFWSAKVNILSLEQLRRLAQEPTRFAIANSDIAPYGKAAKEALIALNLWQTYQDKLVRGMNINQTFQQVRSKAVESGIVAHSQLVLNKLSGFKIPTKYYTPIKQQLVIIKNTKQQQNAQQLSLFLRSKTVQEKISHYGYQPVYASVEVLKNTSELHHE